ncbi:MAG TPA: hypothetical protein VGC50_14490 [Gammaproteobacteria bacterium]|jgi:hypothetical protein
MTTEAYIHVVPEERTETWCLSVSYGGTLAQIRLHGYLNLMDKGTANKQLALELARLGKELTLLSDRPSATH